MKLERETYRDDVLKYFNKEKVLRGGIMELNDKNFVVLEGKEVVSIVYELIEFSDGSKISDRELGYAIADFWKAEVERKARTIEVSFSLDDCKKALSYIPLYKNGSFRKSQIRGTLVSIGVLEPLSMLRSHYDPRDNDYCDSTFTAYTTRYDRSPETAFLETLQRGGYEIIKETSTTILLRSLTERELKQ